METPRKFITAKLSIRKPDEDPGLRIESFALINLRGVSTNKTIILNYVSQILFALCSDTQEMKLVQPS